MPRARSEGTRVPQPDEEKVRKGLPSSRVNYIKEGIPMYRHREGQNRVRFLAWKDGEHFIKYLYTHSRIGVNEDTWACLKKGWSEPCPVCEDAQKQLDAGTEWRDVMEQGILPSKNPRMLIQVVDRKNEEAGVQVLDMTSYKCDNLIRSLSVHEDTGAIIPWWDPVNGCDLIYDYNPRAEFPMPEGLRRSDKCKIDPRFYENIMDFDEDVIYKPSYDEVAKSYYGTEVPDESEEMEEPRDDAISEAVKKAKEEADEKDPLEGGECFEKAYGFYEDCTEGKDSCPDIEKCKASKKWTGDKCPECGLPLYEEKGRILCALGHVKEEMKEETQRRRRRRA